MKILVGSLGDLDKSVVREMFYFRYLVFKKRLEWRMECAGEQEFDEFDGSNAIYIVGLDAESGKVIGCMRLIPSLHPYMLERVFPFLLEGKRCLKSPRVWEMSRFACSGRQTSGRLGFSADAFSLVEMAFKIAGPLQIDHYLLVTTLPVERLMRLKGLVMRRMGRPVHVDGVLSVAIMLAVKPTKVGGSCSRPVTTVMPSRVPARAISPPTASSG